MRVLVIKLSSMGDVIHILPAITDSVTHNPDIKFDWLVDEQFAEIPSWHPSVDRVISIALREKKVSKILKAVFLLRKRKYDLVIDAQGLLKSAIFAKISRSKRSFGYDKESCREPSAAKFYNKKIKIEQKTHAITKMRNLFAKVFGYEPPKNQDNYGINWPEITDNVKNQKPYIVFLHGTTWKTKHWPDRYWHKLADMVVNEGYQVQVTWANEEQKLRAQTLAKSRMGIDCLPNLTLTQAASLLLHAKGVIAVDTGFAHLASAIGIPTVAMYGPTSAELSGVVGHKSVNIQSKFICAPCMQRECTYPGEIKMFPPCFEEIDPSRVLEEFKKLIS